MKKFLTAALACCIAVSALCFGVNAQGKNYLSTEWGKGLDVSVEKKEDGVYKITNLKNSWSSSFLPSLSSIKEAVKNEESIVVTFKIRAIYLEDSDATETTTYVLFRGTPDGTQGAEAWLEAYDEALDGEDALFTCDKGGNVMFYGPRLTLSEEEWTLVEWTIPLTQKQADCSLIQEWNLCIDNISNNSSIAAVEIKDTGIYCESDYESKFAPEETPAPEEPEQPGEEATPTPTMKNMFDEKEATATPAPVESTATAKATEAPAENKDGNSLWWVWVVVAVVVIGGGAAVYFLVIKKKKDINE